MTYSETILDFGFLQDWETEFFHLLNAAAMQVGYYDKEIAQMFLR